jgi:hypothetical protein
MNQPNNPEDRTNSPEGNPKIWVDADTIMNLLCIKPSTLKQYRLKELLVWTQPNNGKILYLWQSGLDLLDRNKRGGTQGLSIFYFFLALGNLAA